MQSFDQQHRPPPVLLPENDSALDLTNDDQQQPLDLSVNNNAGRIDHSWLLNEEGDSIYGERKIPIKLLAN